MFNIVFGTIVVVLVRGWHVRSIHELVGLIASIALCSFVLLLAYIGRGEAP